MTRKYNSKKLVFGVGVKGDGVAKVNMKLTKPYITWYNMLKRCYDSRFHKLQPNYIGCSVCAEWLYFPTFKQWFDTHYVEGWHLDKDLLVDGNKEYGPDACIFVPQQINKLFTDHGRARGEHPLGVCFDKETGKFMVQLAIDGKQKKLGRFNDPNKAYKAYLVAKKENVIRTANEWRDRIPDKLYIALIRKANDLI